METKNRVSKMMPPVFFVVLAGFLAWVLKTPYARPLGLGIVRDLANYELFHWVGHIGIFSSLTILLKRIGASWRLIVIFVLSGTLAIEGMQVVGPGILTMRMIKAALFDFGVNLIGTFLGLLIFRSNVSSIK